MKLFLAVAPDGLDQNRELLQIVGKLKRTVQERGQVVRWVRPDLWHVTLTFLGSVDENKLRACIDQWRPKVKDLELTLQGLGAFPESDAARILWVGVAATQGFYDLQDDLASTLKEAGFKLEERPYRPHLTLARFRNVSGAGHLIELGQRKRFGHFPLRELILFASTLEGGIMKYMPRARWPLTQDKKR